ncbi:MAG: GIY-YIG nuclease family protein [Candidatus Margulisiibacteriota bacterium]
MCYIYVLQSEKDGDIYIGHTNNLKRRFNQHNVGKVQSTRRRRPFKMLYYECLKNESTAIEREKYMKSGCGRAGLKRLLKRVEFVNKHEFPIDVNL